MLLTGDIERAAEDFLARNASLKAHVLLVPHHGSRTSSSEAFIEAVGPRWAIVPAGYRNRFGHPAREVLARYEGAKVSVLRTDLGGAVSVVLNRDVHRSASATHPAIPAIGACIATPCLAPLDARIEWSRGALPRPRGVGTMAKKGSGTVYRVTEVIGTSANSWEDAARNAVNTAAGTLRDLRIAEIEKLDVRIEDGKIVQFRARLALSFKYDS